MSENPQEHKEEPKVEHTEDNSVLIKDIVLCIARTDKGPAVMSHFSSKQEAVNMMLAINIEIVNKIKEFDKAAHRIEPARHGIINAVRNRLIGR